MRKLNVFLLSTVFIALPVWLFAEDLTITTYYPSPYGSYNELSARKMKIGATYSGSGVSAVDNSLIVEGGIGIGASILSDSLKLDVEGKAGAQEYCDNNGNNCKTIGQMQAVTFPRSDGWHTIASTCDGSNYILTQVYIVSGAITQMRLESSGVFCGVPEGAPTTPYLFTYADGRYFVENDIMGTFFQDKDMTPEDVEQAYKNNDVGNRFQEKDTYKLLLKPTVEKGRIKLQIRELEPEESHIDQVWLLKAVHKKDSIIFADIPLATGKSGEIHNLKTVSEIRPYSCIDEKGNDCLAQVFSEDAQVVDKKADEFIILKFNAAGFNPNNQSYFYFNVWGKNLEPRLIKTPFSQGYSDGPSIIMYYVKDGKWQSIGQDLHPRAILRSRVTRGGDYSIFLPEYIDKDGVVTLKMVWTEPHKLDKISILSFAESAPYRTEELNLVKAEHSKDGDALAALGTQDFSYAHIVRGDKINLEFEAGSLWPQDDEEVDYFFVSRGYYHGLRTYLYPDVDTSAATFEKELNDYVKEYNSYIKERDLPYPQGE